MMLGGVCPKILGIIFLTVAACKYRPPDHVTRDGKLRPMTIDDESHHYGGAHENEALS